MIYDIKDYFKKLFKSREIVFLFIVLLMFIVILSRIFSLQIINGADYQKNFTMKILRPLKIEAARGNIYDCNGRLLAYNELAYSIMINDIGSYSSDKIHNRELNAELAEIIGVLMENGESIANNFKIDYNEDGTYSFNVSGTSLKRFLADVFGQTTYEKLGYNEKFGFNEAEATAAQVMDFLMHDKNKFGVNDGDEQAPVYPENVAYQIVVLRYALEENRYTQYNATTIAQNVSEKTVAYVNEHSNELIGVSIEEDTIRKYDYSEYFSNIIGYTGRISTEEYETLSAEDDSYSKNDIVGKAGLEQYYESYLRGISGEREVYVNNVGKITEVLSSTEPIAGNDLYLNLDAELQKNTYLLLEQEIAGIVYTSISAGVIPMEDVYFALVDNNVVDITHFTQPGASAAEAAIVQSFAERQSEALSRLESELKSSSPTVNNDMSEELLDYFTRIMSILREKEILVSSRIDTEDKVYQDWRQGTISPSEYFKYGISNQWIDISKLNVEEKYADSSEIYEALVHFILETAAQDKEFSKVIYHYMILNGEISGTQLCVILFDQGQLDYDETVVASLQNGSLTPRDFLLDKINRTEITPAQLALEPCTGSCVLTDPNTGAIKALVSYPGYDINRLANGVDAAYFQSLNEDNSRPLYNYATQERTAPGSTFKMVTSTAALAEGIIATTTPITCTGQFMEVSNQPKCHVYPSSHGALDLVGAISASCNVFYYTCGFNLSCKDSGEYNDKAGISYIQKYASVYGLDEKTGLEIEENTPEIADSYPVMAAIGQSNNNLTTSSLSRYVTAIATGKLYKYQLMNKIVDGEGNVIVSYTPEYEDISGVLTQEQWSGIREGMRSACANYPTFEGLKVQAATKSGTAQQENHPNHGLFVGFAPYDKPQLTFAARIAHGYAASNASILCRNVLAVYFGEETVEDILARNAAGSNSVGTNTVAD